MGEENKKEQAAPRSFRITDEVLAKFREIQEEWDLTQDGVLKMLVEAYELEKAKNMIPDRETEIANFQAKANELVDAFLFSLQINQDAEARIRNEVALQLQSKDETIMDLQEKVKAHRELATTANSAWMEAENKRKQAEIDLQEAQDFAKQAEANVKDKAAIVDLLNGKLAEAERKVEEYPVLQALTAELTAKIAGLEQTLKDNQREAEIARERAENAVRDKMINAMTDLEKVKDKQIGELEVELSRAQTSAAEKADRIADLKIEHESEVEKLNAKIDQLRKDHERDQAELIRLKIENERLKSIIQEKKDDREDKAVESGS